MRKLLFRFMLIGLFVICLLQINDEPGKDYGTQIESSVGNIKIDVPGLVRKVPEKLDAVNKVLFQWTEDMLEEFGFASE